MSATLALWGGRPAVDTPAPHFSWPPLTDAAITAVLQQLRTSISIYDRSGVIADLEDALAGYHDTAHALLTSSGTAALHSAYAACGLGQGDEVIVPAYTFLATATPLLHLGATPVLVDCEDSGNIDPYLVEQAITTRTRAIVVTHMWGYPADIIALRDIANRLGVWLIEDGSHAHGASVDGRKVDTFGHLAAFSMNGPKPLSAGEGGFLLTNDDELYHRALLHGHYNKRCRTEIPADHPLHRYATTGMGLKFRIHPLAAAIALDQLGRLDEYLSGRATIAEYMAGELRAMPGIQVQTPAPTKTHPGTGSSSTTSRNRPTTCPSTCSTRRCTPRDAEKSTGLAPPARSTITRCSNTRSRCCRIIQGSWPAVSGTSPRPNVCTVSH